MKDKQIRVIFDTNIWISFLIGKSLTNVKSYLSDRRIIIVVCKQLIDEVIEVTAREKLKKYFKKESVDELIIFLDAIAEYVDIKPIHFLNRDPKDNFLLDLIDLSKANFLVTGDKDLLDFTEFMTAQIITPTEFEQILTTF